MGGAGQPTSDLSLRFPILLGHRTLWAYVFRGFWALGRSRSAPVLRNRPRPSKVRLPIAAFWGVSALGREPLRRVQGPICLIQYTCYLILDNRHLRLDTWHLILAYLYLIPVLIHLILATEISLYSRVPHKGAGGYIKTFASYVCMPARKQSALVRRRFPHPLLCRDVPMHRNPVLQKRLPRQMKGAPWHITSRLVISRHATSRDVTSRPITSCHSHYNHLWYFCLGILYWDKFLMIF